ncbi:MAG: ATP-binding protein [Patescibacteria group bacterium]
MNIIGHQKIVEFLNRSIKQNKITHAYLFYGPENVGKETVAIRFVTNLLTKNFKKEEKTKIENQIIKRIHPDIYWLEKEGGKKNISIEQIRNLQTILSLKPLSDSYKIAIINRAEEMNIAAANSFLKILEEPPLRSIIILLVNNLKALPETIISRCLLIKFNPVPLKEIKKFLIEVYKLPESEAEVFSQLSFGRPGLVMQFLKNPEKYQENKKGVENFLNLLKVNLAERFNFVNKNLENWPFLTWQIVLRDCLLIKNGLKPINEKEKIETIAKKWPEKKFYQIIKLIEKIQKQIKLNVNKRLALENLVINL